MCPRGFWTLSSWVKFTAAIFNHRGLVSGYHLASPQRVVSTVAQSPYRVLVASYLSLLWLGKLYKLISSVPTWSQACFAAIIKAIEPALSGDDVFLWFDVLILRVLMSNPFIYKNCGPEKSYFLHLKFINNESRTLIGDLSLLSVW